MNTEEMLGLPMALPDGIDYDEYIIATYLGSFAADNSIKDKDLRRRRPYFLNDSIHFFSGGGAFTRVFTIAAIALLFLYYIAAPPFVGYVYSIPMEGSYLIVNKVLIELAAVFVLLAFPTSMSFGLDRLIFWKKSPEFQALKRANA